MADLDPTSRYAGLPTVTVALPDGSTRVLGAPRVAPALPTRGTYRARSDDRLDLMAHAITGDSTRWWVIADANPWADATRLETPGQTIELPDA